jgi:sporulation protein YlmC with PRC-barrel domain
MDGASSVQSLGQPVYNDNNERVGSVDDIIITPEKAVSYAIIGTGGFLGLAKHNVAIPAIPEFQYAQ